MAGNGSTADEQALLEEALRMSMEVNDDTTNGTGSQSNSTTEVGGTQSRSAVSAGEFAQMFALCLATAVYQQSLSPPVSQGPALMDQSGTEFPLSIPRVFITRTEKFPSVKRVISTGNKHRQKS